MTPVRRDQIVDYATYEDEREAFRTRVIEVKRRRRIHIGDHLTLLFENPVTVRYQIQEMLRAERIVREAEIVHEIETYNELLGGDGELGCTLLIEIENPAERDEKLRAWRDLPAHVYLATEAGTRVAARFDERQRDADRLSAVQYLRFEMGGHPPVAAGVHMPGLSIETRLTPEQRESLAEDLTGE